MVTYLHTKTSKSELVKAALGEVKSDTIIQDVNVVNVITRETYDADVAVRGDRIAFVGDASHTVGESSKIIRASGLFATPGLMDGHIHVESSMLSLEEFSCLVVPHGTTCINADAHEISNVLGIKGFRLFHERSRHLPLRIFMVAPSSVPLTRDEVEIPSKAIGLDNIRTIMKMENVLGLGEILNTNELLKGSRRLAAKVQAALESGKYIDGNAPGLSGKQLNAYMAAGPQHDHEAVSPEEALERLRLGMWVMLREGSSERNLADLAEIIRDGRIDARRCCFATDDKDPRDLAAEGHLDHCLRKSVRSGVSPTTAIQMATINCAEYLGLERELGSISPGKIADIVLFEDLENFNVKFTIAAGEIVAENGKPTFRPESRPYPKWATHTFRMQRQLKQSDLTIPTPNRKKVTVRIIDVTKGTITSEMKIAELIVQDQKLNSDIERDILKVAVVERYGKTNLAVGKGFTRGFGLKHGAIASSVAHDTHNIICVGTNDSDMVAAINQVSAMQGGLVAIREGRVIARLQLRLGGIMSTESWQKVSKNLELVHTLVREQLGCKQRSPFMVLAFESTASVPELKISTRGLIHTATMRILPLAVNEDFSQA